MAPRALLLSAFLLFGCFPPGEGIAPPPERVYFPVGLAVDAQQNFLYIVNSDFDLQFNAGTVQSWDLAALRSRVPRYCESNADCDAAETCDLFVPTEELKQTDPEAYVDNGGVPSHWCLPKTPVDRTTGEPVFVGPASTPCGAFEQQTNRDQSLYPGRCGFIDPVRPQNGGDPILPPGAAGKGRSVLIGAFATDVVRRKPVEPAGWKLNSTVERLFIPVRGDATLHWIDLGPNGTLECGQGGADDGACDDNHRRGDRSEEENTRSDGRLAPEPFGLDADEDGLTLMVSSQTSGSVALFSHKRTVTTDSSGTVVQSTIDWANGPDYVFREGGLPQRPIGVASVPVPLSQPSSGRERLPGYLVSFRDAASLFLLRVYDDAAADPARPYTRRYESEPIFTNSSGVDSRGLAVDPFQRKAAEQTCLERFAVDPACANDPACLSALGPEAQQCLEEAAAIPLDVFVSNRSPSSLILGRSQPVVSDAVVTDLPAFYGTIPLDVGPSRVFVGDIVNERGERERRVFVVCFDSRRVAIYDPARRRLEMEIVTGRGPHALAFDITDDHAYAYVGHFLDSYVGVVDLDQRHRGMYGAMIATVGDPQPPRASK